MVGGKDLDQRRALGCRERRFQYILSLGLFLVVVTRDCDDKARLGLGDQEVRTVRVLGDQAAAMKSRDRADAVGTNRGGVECERAAEAIALHPRSLAAVGLLLLVEQADERRRVLVDRGVGQRRL